MNVNLYEPIDRRARSQVTRRISLGGRATRDASSKTGQKTCSTSHTHGLLDRPGRRCPPAWRPSAIRALGRHDQSCERWSSTSGRKSSTTPDLARPADWPAGGEHVNPSHPIPAWGFLPVGCDGAGFEMADERWSSTADGQKQGRARVLTPLLFARIERGPFVYSQPPRTPRRRSWALWKSGKVMASPNDAMRVRPGV
jgi:hypothetical protein